jgi:hypothetical protein
VPFVFTANFKWITPFPSCVVALAFYGVNEIGRCMEVGPGGICFFFCPDSLRSTPQIQPIMLGLCPIMHNYADWFPKDVQVKFPICPLCQMMPEYSAWPYMEDPFSWDEPCHDLSGTGWRIYRENLQIHERADEAEQEAEEEAAMRVLELTASDEAAEAAEAAGDASILAAALAVAAAPAPAAAGNAHDVTIGTPPPLSTGDRLRNAISAAPLVRAAAHAMAVEQWCVIEDENVAAGIMPAAALVGQCRWTLSNPR